MLLTFHTQLQPESEQVKSCCCLPACHLLLPHCPSASASASAVCTHFQCISISLSLWLSLSLSALHFGLASDIFIFIARLCID